MFFHSSTGALKVVVGEPPASGPSNLGYGFTSLEAMYVIPWDPAVTLPSDTVYSGGFARTSRGGLYVTVGTPSAAEKSFGVPARTAKGVAFVTADAPAGGSTYTAPWGMVSSAGVLHIADLTFGVEFADAGSGVASIVAGIGGVTATFTRATAASCRLSNGLLKKVATGVPRSHYAADGTYLGYLAEGARTNLCLQSEDLGTTWANTRSTDSVNATVAPDGTTTADKLIEDATATSTHNISQNWTPAAAVHTASFFVKAGERTWCRLTISDATTTFGCYFDVANGVVGTASNATGAAIESWGDGWYRCSFTTNAAMANTAGVIALRLATADNGESYSGDGASGMYFWGSQVEAAAFASSYIPTTTIAVARNADVLTYPGDNLADEGTIFAESTAPSDPATGLFSRVLELSDGTTNERVGIARNTGVGRVFIFDGGVNQFPATQVGDAWADGATKKFALRFAVDNCAASLAGSAVLADTSITVPSGLNNINVGLQQGGSANWFGTIRRAAFYGSLFSNTDLQQVTR